MVGRGRRSDADDAGRRWFPGKPGIKGSDACHVVRGPTIRLRFREVLDKTVGCTGDFADGGVERGLVQLRRLVIAADLAHKLEGGGGNVVGRDGFSGAAEHFAAAAHICTLSYGEVARGRVRCARRAARRGRGGRRRSPRASAGTGPSSPAMRCGTGG